MKRTGANDPRPHRLSLLLRVFIGLVLLAWVIRPLDLQDVVRRIAALSPLPTLALCAALVLRRVLMAYKWALLLRARQIPISTWQAIRLYHIGYLVGTFIPVGIGNVVYRIAALSGYKKNQIVISSILIERIIGTAVIGAMAAMGLPVSIRYLPQSGWLAWGIALGAALTILVVALSLNAAAVSALGRQLSFISPTRLRRRLKEFYEAYAEYRHHRSTLIAFTLLTVAEAVTLISLTYWAAVALGIKIPFLYLLGTMSILHILLRLPISIDGIGLQEGLFAYLFVLGGLSAADGLSVSLLQRLAGLLAGHLPAAIMLCFGTKRLGPAENHTELSMPGAQQTPPLRS